MYCDEALIYINFVETGENIIFIFIIHIICHNKVNNNQKSFWSN